MDITKLRSFLVLANCKSFTDTANQLFLSQPAISKHIDSLEKELGILLVNRNRGHISLTIHGEYFLPYASEMVRLSENSKEHLRQLEDMNEGTLHFGATNFIGVYLLPKLLREFQEYYPKIEVNMTVAPSKKLFNMLERHELEFAFLSHYVDLDDSKYHSLFYELDHMVLIVAKQHPLAALSSCKLHEIANEVFISKESSSSLTRFLRKQFNGKPFKKQLTISNQEGIKQAVIQNIGVSIMSSKAVEVEVAAGLIQTIEIEDFNLDREINIIHHKKFTLTPAGNAFFDILGMDLET